MREETKNVKKSNIVMTNKVKRSARTIKKILKDKHNVVLSHINCIIISLLLASYQDEEDLLIIDSVEKAKLVAKVLKKNLLIQFNIDIKYSAGLEIVSAIFGYRSWNAACAIFKKGTRVCGKR